MVILTGTTYFSKQYFFTLITRIVATALMAMPFLQSISGSELVKISFGKIILPRLMASMRI